MTTVICDYAQCGQSFKRKSSEVSRSEQKGANQFCSPECNAKYRRENITVQEPNVECGWCHKEIYRLKNRITKSKTGLFFCSNEHANLAKKRDGISDVSIAYYGEVGKGVPEYRKKAFAFYAHRCDGCGYDEVPEILVVHHIDCNRMNNVLENLRILCSTCHEEIHFLSSTGRWAGTGHE